MQQRRQIASEGDLYHYFSGGFKTPLSDFGGRIHQEQTYYRSEIQQRQQKLDQLQQQQNELQLQLERQEETKLKHSSIPRPESFRNPKIELRKSPLRRASSRIETQKLVKDENEEDSVEKSDTEKQDKSERVSSQRVITEQVKLRKSRNRSKSRLSKRVVNDVETDNDSFSTTLPAGGKSNFYHYDLVDDARVESEVGGGGFYEEGSASSTFAKLHEIRYKLEHNEIYKLDLDSKLHLFETLKNHLEINLEEAELSDANLDTNTKNEKEPKQEQRDKESWEVVRVSLRLIHDILPHLGPHTDACLGLVLPEVVSLIGSSRVNIRRAATDILQVHLRLSSDVQTILRGLVQHGLENQDTKTVREVLVAIPTLFPKEESETRHYRGGNRRNLYLLVSGVARKLLSSSTRALAFMSLQRLCEVVGPQQFATYLDRVHVEQRRVYEELLLSQEGKNKDSAMGTGVSSYSVPGNGVVGRRLNHSNGKSWVEYGAIDDAIIEKLKDDEDDRVRLQGAEELNKVIKDMPDLSPLLPQMRLFLNFLDSALDEHNPAAILLILEIYGCLVERLGPRLKPHLRTITASLLRHCTAEDRPAVRAENLRVLKQLMACCGPNQTLNQSFDHLGDKKSAVREAILNVIILALLTFPSYEFDLKGITASVVPTLVDPKRRVRQASQETVAVLASFMGNNPSRSGSPLIRSVELLENHFEKGQGVLEAVQARLARRQLPRITQEGLIEYSVRIPSSAVRRTRMGNVNSSSNNYGKDINWILAGTGSLTTGSAKSIGRPESRMDPATVLPMENGKAKVANGKVQSARSKSQETSKSSISNGTRKKSHTSASRNGVNRAAKGAGSNNITAPEDRSSRHNSLSTAANNVDLLDLSFSSVNNQQLDPNSLNLPRLSTGSKSQASTASSSATRDSGIFVNDKARTAALAALAASNKKANQTGSRKSSSSVTRGREQEQQMSVPNVNGFAVNLANRGSSSQSQQVLNGRPRTKRSISQEEQSQPSPRNHALSRPGNNFNANTTKYTVAYPQTRAADPATSPRRQNASNNFRNRHPYHADDEFSHDNLDNQEDDLLLTNNLMFKSKSENHLEEFVQEISPPRSPRHFPQAESDVGVGSLNRQRNSLLLRPANNSPFNVGTPNVGQGNNNSQFGGSQNSVTAVSTPFSQASVPSSYEYEDDFSTDDDSEAAVSVKTATGFANLDNSIVSRKSRKQEMSAQSDRTVASTASNASSAVNSASGSGGGGSLSRIPIKRNSSMRRKKEIMDNYASPTKNTPDVEAPPPPPALRMSSQEDRAPLLPKRRGPKENLRRAANATKSLERIKKVSKNKNISRNVPTQSKSVGALNKIGGSEDPFKKSAKIVNSPRVERKAFEEPPVENKDNAVHVDSNVGGPFHVSDDGTKIDSVTTSSDEVANNYVGARMTPPLSAPLMGMALEPAATSSNGENHHQSSDDVAIESLSRISTANSTTSTGFQHVQLQTLVTLKSPFEGQKQINEAPPPPSEAFLNTCLEQLGAGEWETNVTGMTGIVRLARHEADVLITEHKALMALLLKQIKNLRSQVCRAAAHTVAELFLHLKKSMEPDLEKIAIPLIHKTGDTNKFLREDCHVALDAMVNNLGEKKVISIATSDVLTHKNPTIRGTVSRLVALLTEKHGVEKILSGQKDVTDKVVPAVAKLAQDGSQEARLYAKFTLSIFMESHPDWERILKRNLDQNTMRSLEKILEALKTGNGDPTSRRNTPGYATLGGRSRKLLRRRTAPNRQTL